MRAKEQETRKLREVPEKEWGELLKEINKNKKNWETRIEVIDPMGNTQTVSNGLHLNGISFASSDKRIEILLHGDEKRHLTHTVLRTIRLSILRADKFHDCVIEIAEYSGSLTRIRLFNPIVS